MYLHTLGVDILIKMLLIQYFKGITFYYRTFHMTRYYNLHRCQKGHMRWKTIKHGTEISYPSLYRINEKAQRAKGEYIFIILYTSFSYIVTCLNINSAHEANKWWQSKNGGANEHEVWNVCIRVPTPHYEKSMRLSMYTHENLWWLFVYYLIIVTQQKIPFMTFY